MLMGVWLQRPNSVKIKIKAIMSRHKEGVEEFANVYQLGSIPTLESICRKRFKVSYPFNLRYIIINCLINLFILIRQVRFIEVIL